METLEFKIQVQLTIFIRFLLFDELVHSLDQDVVVFLLGCPVVLLVDVVVIVFLHKDVSVNADMEDQVVDLLVNLEQSLLERELAKVVRSLRVVRIECFDDLLFLLLSG